MSTSRTTPGPVPATSIDGDRSVPASHVCLAGPAVSSDWDLIGPLKKIHQVTVLERLGMLHANSILATASVLILDCADQEKGSMEAIRALRCSYPRLQIVLVNGGLTPAEIAKAFQDGAHDYFSRQSDPGLVAERVQHLCRQARRRAGRPWKG